jgi:hypothetical protein
MTTSSLTPVTMAAIRKTANAGEDVKKKRGGTLSSTLLVRM